MTADLRPPPTRRAVIGGAALGLSAGGGYAARTGQRGRVPTGYRDLPLHSECVAWFGPDQRDVIPAGHARLVVPGTRVRTDAADAGRLVEREELFLAAGALWTRGPGRWSDLVGDALRDLHVLSLGLPASVASWRPAWRYIWPRDASFVAVALAVSGHLGLATKALTTFAQLPLSGNVFHARYRTDTLIPPDARLPQADGAGWILWACATVLETIDDGDRADILARLRPTIEIATDAVLATHQHREGLPLVTPDYWERPERSLPLGVAAPIVAGLAHAVGLNAALDRPDVAERCRVAAGESRGRVVEAFGPSGFQRYPRGGGADTAIVFLLPPYADAPDGKVLRLLAPAQRALRAPAGGISPGQSWDRDGVSWTPETLLFALAWARAGDRERAEELLGWVERHRTCVGAIPEKVRYDGRPAAVAPLGWSAALAVLTAYELRR